MESKKHFSAYLQDECTMYCVIKYRGLVKTKATSGVLLLDYLLQFDLVSQFMNAKIQRHVAILLNYYCCYLAISLY